MLPSVKGSKEPRMNTSAGSLAIASAFSLFSVGIQGQSTGTAKPRFEVASVKPSNPTPGPNDRMAFRSNGRFEASGLSLAALVSYAYSVENYQISRTGPGWIYSDRYDIVAKEDGNVSNDQVSLMVQSLLEDRFKLTLHREPKELQVLALIVGKNGPKLKKSESSPFGAGPNVATPPPPPAGGRGPGPGGPGMIRMMMRPGGQMRLNATGMDLSNFAEMLSRQVGKPVFDNTGITGVYDFDLEFKPEEGMGMMRGMPTPMPRPEGAGGEPHSPPLDNVEAPSIFTAVQDQLGLKLESKKGPIETVVVDYSEKVPTEN